MLRLMLFAALVLDKDERNKLEELYELYRQDSYRAAMRIARNSEIAEDAVHDAFMAAIRHKEKYCALDGNDFRRCIVIIAKNKAIDILRKNKHIADIPPEDADGFPGSEEHPVEAEVMRKDDLRVMTEVLHDIDEISRAVLQMKYILGMSYKEIGVELGIPPNHVETRIARAQAKARKRIAEKGGDSHES
jgi:RNA polymerase sigma-70 factor (ECF subfamily)